MSEFHISLRGEKAEAFERVKDDLGPEGVDLSNAQAVMRLVEEYEDAEEDLLPGGLR
ncbi:MAG: hypothetical protein ABEH78_07955 [Haloferacaceae archaeon]